MVSLRTGNISFHSTMFIKHTSLICFLLDITQWPFALGRILVLRKPDLMNQISESHGKIFLRSRKSFVFDISGVPFLMDRQVPPDLGSVFDISAVKSRYY